MLLAYFDCIAGLSGTTLLEALFSVGVSRKQVDKALAGLPGGDDNKSVAGPGEFRTFVAASDLPLLVKQTADAILKRLHDAEVTVHSEDDMSALQMSGWQGWQLSELRAAVGVVLGLSLLRIGRVECSPLRVGGWQMSNTGKQAEARKTTFSPITAEILCGSSVPVYGSDQGGENVTPVGAALVAALASSFGPLPSMTIGGIGYGREEAKQTRVFIGQAAAVVEPRVAAASKAAMTTVSARIEGTPSPQMVQVTATKAVPAQEATSGLAAAQVARGGAPSQSFVPGLQEWVALSIKGHQQSGRQRV